MIENIDDTEYIFIRLKFHFDSIHDSFERNLDPKIFN